MIVFFIYSFPTWTETNKFDNFVRNESKHDQLPSQARASRHVSNLKLVVSEWRGVAYAVGIRLNN
jgi:hypothetical protein